ncbi:Molecular chaperone (small heat shock protein)- like protein [Denitrovibrio acetiphilus DSM 12809]|uniref:Molecular chaperone (Small heat shock protein)-like protein n=1 Tax=Denitrovibrio acetiphilus (strain DSM 12809 / NBRC 114555 / N2460) TaxID=522772 RepID=D4H0T9_DENA2|nr:Hsp20/alpha crystallin family protein [Denitrovibrio acetiphilus]ADD68602.1 Molecular chaperone (small heat shock protein)- like protein [Denitrovibrio acetiphilus DSM 12809]
MNDNYDSNEKIRFIHGLLKKEVEDLIHFISSSKVNLADTNSPPMDVVINDKEVIIYIELPGLTTSHFTVYQYDDLVVIEGVRPKMVMPKASFVRVERESVRFRRILRLPFCVNEGDSKAKLKDGVLEVHISRGACECSL